MDAVQAFPAVILALALLAVLGPSLRNVVIVIGVALAPGYARVVRAMTRAAKQNPYVEAELSLGAGSVRIAITICCPTSRRRSSSSSPWTSRAPSPSRPASRFSASASRRPARPGAPCSPTASATCYLSVGDHRRQPRPDAHDARFALLGETLRDVLDPKFSGVRRRKKR